MMASELAAMAGNWNYPSAIRFGAGRLVELPEACRELGMSRPLLVTDPGLAALPPALRSLEVCRDAGLACALFSEVRGNPIEANVNAGVRAFAEGERDGVIALGGGSALDAGKAIAFMAGQHRRSGTSRIARTGGHAPTRPASRR